MQNDKAAALILVVDDQCDMLHMMKMMLERCGYQVETARSAQHALCIVSETCPHLIISDIGMPDMDGCEMMSVLRKRHGAGAFKAIALTGYGLPCDQTRIQQSGFDLCLLKPVDFETFVEHVEQMLQAHAATQLESRLLHFEPDARAEHDNAPFYDAASTADHEQSLQMAAEH